MAALALAACGGGGGAKHRVASAAVATPPSVPATIRVKRHPAPKPRPRAPFAVGERTLVFVDHSRTVRFPGTGSEPRKLVTVVRYPAVGPASAVDAQGALPARAAGPFPLVIFGHGFAVTPTIYARLLQSWTRAGYVVAAPIFPLENANAPGGPNENDLGNQPQDMSFVITRMLAASSRPRGVLSGLIDPREVAVTGQSDGGETALAVAYDSLYIDHRVRAAVILSGAKIPGVGGFDFPPPSPPLLATQGTADTVNPPSFTTAFFDTAPQPKYLLAMFGAPHLGPYTDEQPQLGIVEGVTVAFLDRYLRGAPGALRRMLAAGDVPRVASVSR